MQVRTKNGTGPKMHTSAVILLLPSPENMRSNKKAALLLSTCCITRMGRFLKNVAHNNTKGEKTQGSFSEVLLQKYNRSAIAQYPNSATGYTPN